MANSSSLRKRRAGRRVAAGTRCTGEVTDKIAALIAEGNTQKCACMCVGIHPHTFVNWMHRGEQNQARCYRAFFDTVTKARGIAERRCVKIWSDAIQAGDWKAARSWLQHRSPEWAPPWQRVGVVARMEVEHSGGIMAAIAGDATAVELLGSLAEHLARRPSQPCEPGGGPQ